LHCITSLRCGASQITLPIGSGSPLRTRFLFRGRETVSIGAGGDGKKAELQGLPTAQFGRCGNTIRALLWARPGAEARGVGGGPAEKVRCLLEGTKG
jgi:hypothetical protein